MAHKIYDLDPNEVEDFIKKLFFLGREQREGFYASVRWFPTDNSFEVHLEKKWQSYNGNDSKYFDGKKVTIKSEEDIHMDHEHFDYDEIYGRMTSEVYLSCDNFDMLDREKSIYRGYYKGISYFNVELLKDDLKIRNEDYNTVTNEQEVWYEDIEDQKMKESILSAIVMTKPRIRKLV